jgi:hypothetical protein
VVCAIHDARGTRAQNIAWEIHDEKFFDALIIPIRDSMNRKKILTICSLYRIDAVVELP